jgi:histidinol-phosphate/aromatic aminotransferase/cobyric acid decarboxylase-like protein
MNQDYLKASRDSDKRGKHDYCMSSNYDEKLVRFFPKISNKEIYNLSANYPTQTYEDLKRSIQKLFKIKNVILSAGCEDLIIKICKSISKSKYQLGVVIPTFYRITDNLHKFTPIDWNNIENTDYKRFDYVFIVNPNALNGQNLSKKIILNIIKQNPNTIFIIDETSILFLENWKQISLTSEINKNNNLLIITSLGKFFGLSGQRIGFATGLPELLTRLQLGQETFPISNISAFIVNNIISNSSFAKIVRQRILKNKGEIFKLLEKSKKIGLMPSLNNCIYCFSKHGFELHKILDRVGIFGLDLDCQKGITQKGLVRLTIHGSPTKHKFLIEKLKLIK